MILGLCCPLSKQNKTRKCYLSINILFRFGVAKKKKTLKKKSVTIHLYSY